MTAAPSQTEHDVVPPRMQIPTSNAPGPSTMSNSSVDLPNNEDSVIPVYSQNTNEQGTFQNFESNVNSVHEIPSISNDLGNNVSSDIRQKILNGEYIDLGWLLSNSVPIDDNSNTLIIKDCVLQSKPKASTVKINSISQEQAWSRWLKAIQHGLKQYIEDVLLIIRRVARAQTTAHFDEAISNLKESYFWITHIGRIIPEDSADHTSIGSIELSNGVVLELKHFLEKNGKGIWELAQLISNLFSVFALTNPKSIQSKIHRLCELKKKLNSKKKVPGYKNISDLLSKSFEPPVKQVPTFSIAANELEHEQEESPANSSRFEPELTCNTSVQTETF
ncbi:unnamed protein product [Mytilus coruscus]|uniref:Uncharacterized protein n=1 Tax=Mytilus coruscus TaxID=42192 RepID=A0A6J8BCH9_MYTCO|nr:unnamed protein product [Mytilus coruscus]